MSITNTKKELERERTEAFNYHIPVALSKKYNLGRDKEMLVHFIVKHIYVTTTHCLSHFFSLYYRVMRTITQFKLDYDVFDTNKLERHDLRDDVVNTIQSVLNKLHIICLYYRLAINTFNPINHVVSREHEQFLINYLTDYFVLQGATPMYEKRLELNLPEEVTESVPQLSPLAQWYPEIHSQIKRRLKRGHEKFLDIYYFNKGLAIL